MHKHMCLGCLFLTLVGLFRLGRVEGANTSATPAPTTTTVVPTTTIWMPCPDWIKQVFTGTPQDSSFDHSQYVSKVNVSKECGATTSQGWTPRIFVNFEGPFPHNYTFHMEMQCPGSCATSGLNGGFAFIKREQILVNMWRVYLNDLTCGTNTAEGFGCTDPCLECKGDDNNPGGSKCWVKGECSKQRREVWPWSNDTMAQLQSCFPKAVVQLVSEEQGPAGSGTPACGPKESGTPAGSGTDDEDDDEPHPSLAYGCDLAKYMEYSARLGCAEDVTDCTILKCHEDAWTADGGLCKDQLGWNNFVRENYIKPNPALSQCTCDHMCMTVSTASTMTCGAVKGLYKANACCGNPSKMITLGARRLSSTAGTDKQQLLADIKSKLENARSAEELRRLKNSIRAVYEEYL